MFVYGDEVCMHTTGLNHFMLRCSVAVSFEVHEEVPIRSNVVSCLDLHN